MISVFFISISDLLSQMETIPTLTPSSELISSPPAAAVGAGVAAGDQLTNLDLSSLFSAVPGGSAPTVGAGVPVSGGASNGTFTMDLSLINSGILTIDSSSVGSSSSAALSKAVDPLILSTGTDMGPHHSLDRSVGDVLPSQSTIHLDEVQTVPPEALGTLSALGMQSSGASGDPGLQHPLSSTGGLHVEPTSSLVVAPVAELLASSSKVIDVGGGGETGALLGCVEVLGPQDGGKVLPQFVFPSQSSSSSFSPQKEQELSAVSPSSFLVSSAECALMFFFSCALMLGTNQRLVFSLTPPPLLLLVLRTAAGPPGPTTEPSSWPRRRSREAHQLPLPVSLLFLLHLLLLLHLLVSNCDCGAVGLRCFGVQSQEVQSGEGVCGAPSSPLRRRRRSSSSQWGPDAA